MAQSVKRLTAAVLQCLFSVFIYGLFNDGTSSSRCIASNERITGFEVLAAVNMSALYWVVTPCGLVRRYQSFGGTLSPSVGFTSATVRYTPEDQHQMKP
jgi:hypothetical protein